jgi:protein-disulfide isomerase
VTHDRHAALSSLAALVLIALLSLLAVGPALAQSDPGAIAIEPVSLPDMALGPKTAPVTIVDYSSMTCSHCADFEQNSLPLLRSRYIDTGYVRFVFREFPLDNGAVAASMLARCIANDDSNRYFSAIDSMYRREGQLVNDTIGTLKSVGKQYGMDDQQVENCLSDQQLLDKFIADQKIAKDMVKINMTPTFVINGRTYKGNMPFDQMEGIIRSQLGR